MTPISRVEVFAWDQGASSLPFAVWGGAGQVADGAFFEAATEGTRTVALDASLHGT